MISAITACENICQDFGWVPSILSVTAEVAVVGANFAVILGAIFAYRQLEVWRLRQRAERQADAAVALLGYANEMQQFLTSIRLLFHSPRKGLGAISASKLKHIEKMDGLYKSLQKAKALTVALTSTEELKTACEELLDVYVEVRGAAFVLGDEAIDHSLFSGKGQKILEELTSVLDGKENDEIERRLEACMATLEDVLTPLIQLK